MKTANYNIRLDPVVKAKAEETFAEFGLNLSEAINVFLHMSIKLHGFPFEIRNPKLNVETMAAIQETEQI
jgi:DNA-damage-inducible protein J